MSTDVNPEMRSSTPQPVLALDDKPDTRDPPTPNPAEIDTLERIASTAILLESRRWKNSQIPVNRPPQEILIMITIYATAADTSGYEMLICLTHVCSRWRRVITAYPTFWTRTMFGGNNMPASLANIFFQRAKGCDMDVQLSFHIFPRRRKRRVSLTPKRLILPTPSPEQRIRTLSVQSYTWDEAQNVINGWANALSPLEELVIITDDEHPHVSRPPIFVGEALKTLRLRNFAIPGLDHIRAPNLTVLELLDSSETPCSMKTLFDFLDTTPFLEDVSIRPCHPYDFPPTDRKVILPHVRRLIFAMEHVPEVASQLICPSVTSTQLMDVLPDDSVTPLFPPTLHSFLEQYSVEAINKVTMRVSDGEGHQTSLQFHSPSGNTFCFTCRDSDPSDELWSFTLLFDEAVSTLLSFPLSQVVAFTIDTEDSDFTGDPNHIRTKLAEVFEKCSKLQKVVLESYGLGRFPDFSRDKMPSIQALVIKHPKDISWEELVENVTEAAQIRHSKGKPLNRVEIFTAQEHPKIEQLESLVQEVVCSGIDSWKNSDGDAPCT